MSEKHEVLYLKPLPEDDGIISVIMQRIPRWKESELSGDEWRYTMSTTIEHKNWADGGSISESLYGKDFAQMALVLAHRLDDLLIFGNQKSIPYLVKEASEIKVCFQPGCIERPENVYRIKQEFTDFPYQGHKLNRHFENVVVRAFCGKHSHRGDCDLEDNDDNYELVAYFPALLHKTTFTEEVHE